MPLKRRSWIDGIKECRSMTVELIDKRRVLVSTWGINDTVTGDLQTLQSLRCRFARYPTTCMTLRHGLGRLTQLPKYQSRAWLGLASLKFAQDCASL